MPTLRELQATTSSLTVLYAEDEELLRQGMTSSLEKLFRKVDVAVDGEEAWAMSQDQNYDLIITDISMPNMDGISLIQHLKKQNSTVPTIVISAHNEIDKLITLINLGVERFITKPVDKTKLIEALYSVCSAIVNTKRALEYKRELESKVRILNTQIKKDFVRLHKEHKKTQTQNTQSSEQQDSYFALITVEDKDELRDLNEELDYDILLAFQNNKLTAEYVERLANKYQNYGAIVSRYPIFTHVGTNLSLLGRSITDNMDAFIENIQNYRDLLESFNFVLISFRQNVWEEESSTPNFYDPSIISDIALISNMLNHVVDDENEIEFF